MTQIEKEGNPYMFRAFATFKVEKANLKQVVLIKKK